MKDIGEASTQLERLNATHSTLQDDEKLLKEDLEQTISHRQTIIDHYNSLQADRDLDLSTKQKAVSNKVNSIEVLRAEIATTYSTIQECREKEIVVLEDCDKKQLDMEMFAQKCSALILLRAPKSERIENLEGSRFRELAFEYDADLSAEAKRNSELKQKIEQAKDLLYLYQENVEDSMRESQIQRMEVDSKIESISDYR